MHDFYRTIVLYHSHYMYIRTVSLFTTHYSLLGYYVTPTRLHSNVKGCVGDTVRRGVMPATRFLGDRKRALLEIECMLAHLHNLHIDID